MATSKFEAVKLTTLLGHAAVQQLYASNLLHEDDLSSATDLLSQNSLTQLQSPTQVAAVLQQMGFALAAQSEHLPLIKSKSVEQLRCEALNSAEHTQNIKQLVTAHKLASEIYGKGKNIAGITLLQHGEAVANSLIAFKMDMPTVLAGLLNHVSETDDLAKISETLGDDEVTMRIRDLRKLDIYTNKVTERRNSSRKEIETQLAEIGADASTIACLTDPKNPISTLLERAAQQLTSKQQKTSEYKQLIQTVERVINHSEATLEAIRRALLSVINNDVRIVIVRLVMSLHTLRAAGPDAGHAAIAFETRRRIASDVRNIYAPLANRLGIWSLKWELEDLSFKYLEPAKHKEISRDLEEKRASRASRVQDAIQYIEARIDDLNADASVTSLPAPIRKKLLAIKGFTFELDSADTTQQYYLAQDKLKISAEISGRAKHIYSIYKKMERKNLDFKDVIDALAIRIIINHDLPEAAQLMRRIVRSPKDGSFIGLAPLLPEDVKQFEPIFQALKFSHCYRVLGIVHNLWEPESDEYDDYIFYPKPNGYRSLHTAVLDKDGYFVEVQIRTRTMHVEAEQGFAAHWAYKEGVRPNAVVARQLESLRTAVDTEALDQPTGQKIRSQDERVFVFTPTNDVVELQKGSTPIDFAYAIHSGVGHRTRGAKVGNKMVPLTYQLQSGDMVSIITASKEKPNREWMSASSNYAITNRARSRIRRWFRENEREKNVEEGGLLVERELKRLRVSADIDIEEIGQRVLKDEYQGSDQFLTNIAFGLIRMSQIEGTVALILRDRKKDEPVILEELPDNRPVRQSRASGGKGLQIQGLTGLHTNIAKCCNPIPPEKIVGYVTRGNGISIHRVECKQVPKKGHPDRNLVLEDVSWGEQSANSKYHVPFRIKAVTKAGILNEIATALSGQSVSLVKTKVTQLKNHTSVYILTEVKDVKQAEWIKDVLGKIDNIFDVRF